jgi:hypothetical protein
MGMKTMMKNPKSSLSVMALALTCLTPAHCFPTSSVTGNTGITSATTPNGVNSKPASLSSHGGLPIINPEGARDASQSLDLSQKGDQFMKAGYPAKAVECYQKALDLWPTSKDALYGMGRCAAAVGDLERAVGYYRSAFYSDEPSSQGFREGNGSRLMEFALLLKKAGLRAEALRVYQYGYHRLPTDRGPLPPLFTTPDFAAADFEAAADTAMGIYGPSPHSR